MTAPKFLSFSPAPLSYSALGSEHRSRDERGCWWWWGGQRWLSSVDTWHWPLADEMWMVTVTIVSTLLFLSQVARHQLGVRQRFLKYFYQLHIKMFLNTKHRLTSILTPCSSYCSWYSSPPSSATPTRSRCSPPTSCRWEIELALGSIYLEPRLELVPDHSATRAG